MEKMFLLSRPEFSREYLVCNLPLEVEHSGAFPSWLDVAPEIKADVLCAASLISVVFYSALILERTANYVKRPNLFVALIIGLLFSQCFFHATFTALQVREDTYHAELSIAFPAHRR